MRKRLIGAKEDDNQIAPLAYISQHYHSLSEHMILFEL
jgi:hypothetical protein